MAGPAAQRGLTLDAALRLLLQGDARGMEPLTDTDRESVRWAADTIMEFAGDDGVEVREDMLKMRTPGIEHAGTADVVCSSKAWVGDLKTGQIRDYYAQMAAYSYALMEQHFATEWQSHLIFCDQRKVVSHRFTYEQAKETVERIVNFARDPWREPRACEYCGWCKHQDQCPAVVLPVTNTFELVEKEKGLSALRDRLLADPAKLGQFAARRGQANVGHQPRRDTWLANIAGQRARKLRPHCHCADGRGREVRHGQSCAGHGRKDGRQGLSRMVREHEPAGR